MRQSGTEVCSRGAASPRERSVLGGSPVLLTGRACRGGEGCWPGKGTLLSHQACRARLKGTNAY